MKIVIENTTGNERQVVLFGFEDSCYGNVAEKHEQAWLYSQPGVTVSIDGITDKAGRREIIEKTHVGNWLIKELEFESSEAEPNKFMKVLTYLPRYKQTVYWPSRHRILDQEQNWPVVIPVKCVLDGLTSFVFMLKPNERITIKTR